MILINLRRVTPSLRGSRLGRLIGQPEYKCSKCKESKPVSAFFVADGRVRYQCKHCHGQGGVNYKRSNSEARKRYASKTREWRIFKEFGITVDEYNCMHDAQKGRCKLCGQPESSPGNSLWGNTGPRRLAVDHNHITNVIRGLLCSNCNRALGLFRDNCQLLRRAVIYIETDGLIQKAHGK